MTGRQRLWHRDGELLADTGWKDGKHHGTLNTYGYGEHAVEEPGAPVGPPLTRRIEADYVDGELRSARFFAKVSDGDADETDFGLRYDGFGDLYLLDVDTGRVRRWGHDRDPWEDGAEFASLDAFAFGVLRSELVHQQRIDQAEAERCFARLGFAWLAPI